MHIDKFYKETFILTLSNLTTGILKFIFSIVLSKDLGAEGLGLYSLIMPIYDLFCCLTCGGMIAAISRKGAMLYSEKDYLNLNKLIKFTLIFDFIWSSIIAIIVFFNANFISTGIIKDTRAIYSIELVCPAILFVALSSILKGYFYSMSKASIPAYIDIFEKFIRITFVMLILSTFVTKDITKSVTTVYCALSVGEFLSFLILFITFTIVKRKSIKIPCIQKHESGFQLIFDVLTISFPLCLNGFLSSILGTASTLIVPRRLVSSGIKYTTALSMIGKFSGMALTITFFPLIIITSLCTLLVPEISKKMAQKNMFELEDRINEVVKISLFLGIATFIICLSTSKSLGFLFFNNKTLGPYIKAAALCTPFSYICATTFGILSGLGRQKIILKTSFIMSIEEIILLYIFTGIRNINIYGYAITLFLTAITGLIFNLKEIKKYCYINLKFINIISYILSGILVYFTLSILNNIITNKIFDVKMILLITLGFSLYFAIATFTEKLLLKK